MDNFFDRYARLHHGKGVSPLSGDVGEFAGLVYQPMEKQARR